MVTIVVHNNLYLNQQSVGKESFCEENRRFKRSDRSLLVFAQRKIQATKHGAGEKIPQGASRHQRKRDRGQGSNGKLLN
jgi:hypothetical protein